MFYIFYGIFVSFLCFTSSISHDLIIDIASLSSQSFSADLSSEDSNVKDRLLDNAKEIAPNSFGIDHDIFWLILSHYSLPDESMAILKWREISHSCNDLISQILIPIPFQKLSCTSLSFSSQILNFIGMIEILEVKRKELLLYGLEIMGIKPNYVAVELLTKAVQKIPYSPHLWWFGGTNRTLKLQSLAHQQSDSGGCVNNKILPSLVRDSYCFPLICITPAIITSVGTYYALYFQGQYYRKIRETEDQIEKNYVLNLEENLFKISSENYIVQLLNDESYNKCLNRTAGIVDDKSPVCILSKLDFCTSPLRESNVINLTYENGTPFLNATLSRYGQYFSREDLTKFIVQSVDFFCNSFKSVSVDHIFNFIKPLNNQSLYFDFWMNNNNNKFCKNMSPNGAMAYTGSFTYNATCEAYRITEREEIPVSSPNYPFIGCLTGIVLSDSICFLLIFFGLISIF